MKNEFLPYKQALVLKELGFDEPSFKAYDSKRVLQKCTSDYWDNSSLNRINEATTSDLKVLAPLYQQAFKWFRDKYGLKHDIDDDNLGTKFYYKIKSYTDKFDNYDDILLLIRKEKDWSKIEFKSYEEAELETINKLIEIVKNK